MHDEDPRRAADHLVEGTRVNSPASIADLVGIVEPHAHALGIPGMTLAVVAPGIDGEIHSFGLADPSSGRRVSAHTAFRIGSASKTMTAALVHQLIRDGRVDVDAPIAEYVKTVRVPVVDGVPVTVRHLATHTSGLPEPRRYSDLFRFATGLGIPVGAERPALAEFCGGELRPLAAPGSIWSYSNYGLALLGQLVEEVAGSRFEEHARDALFLPLGMESTDFRRTSVIRQDLAVGHQPSRRDKTCHRPVPDRDIAIPAAGSGFTTASDMVAYLRALVAEPATQDASGPLAPDAGTAGLFGKLWDFGDLMGMGLCWPLEDPAGFGGHRVAWHAGQWPGFNSMLAVAPDAGVGVFLSMNTSLGGIAGSSVGLGKALVRRLLDVAAPATVAPASAQGAARAFGTRGPRRLNAMPLLETGGRVRVAPGPRETVVVSSRIGPLKRGVTLRRADAGGYEGQVEQYALPSIVRAKVAGDALFLTINGVPMPLHAT